jgi:hypothetical protein
MAEEKVVIIYIEAASQDFDRDQPFVRLVEVGHAGSVRL